jgi:hypothetical protein
VCGVHTFALPISLNYMGFDFEMAAQGHIPTRIEETLIDGLVSILLTEDLSTEAFDRTLDVIKEWGSEYALSKLRPLLSGSLPPQRRAMVVDAIHDIEQRLKRKSDESV